jgi:hypothetical protein
MPRGRILDCLCHFLIFRPWNSDDQSRARCPEAISNHLDENQKPWPMIIHQTPAFQRLPPLNLRPAHPPKKFLRTRQLFPACPFPFLTAYDRRWEAFFIVLPGGSPGPPRTYRSMKEAGSSLLFPVWDSYHLFFSGLASTQKPPQNRRGT